MKQLLPLLSAALAIGLPLRAQYNPPPPPEEQQGSMAQQQAPPPNDQAAPAPGDQGQAPSPDQNGAPAMDPNAPPPDGAPGDQGAPPADASAPQDQGDDSGDSANGDANFQTFYDNLSSQGNWVQTDNYGYVWQPNVQDPDWRPYTNGHWVYSDDGWTWVADDSEPWGWATYHYGRWVNLDDSGWVWVPGYTWAPAWVSWRYGGGYCGWAPLPPRTFVGIDVGGTGAGFYFHIGGDCDTAYGIGPAYYNFVPIGYIGARHYHNYYVNRYNNYTIINNTRNVTNIVVNNQAGAGHFGRVVAGGPSFASVNAQSHTPVARVTLARSGRMGNAMLGGGRLAVFAPRVAAAGTTSSFRPRNVAGTISRAQVNNGTDINRPLATTSRVRGTGPTAQQVQAAQGASLRASSAHVATTSTRPTQEFDRPITTYQPHPEPRPAGVTSSASHPAVNHPAASTVRTESSFTGEPSAPSHVVRLEAENANTGETHHVSQASEPAVRHQDEERSFAPEEHHASAPVEHQQAAPEIQQHASFSQPPQQHQDFHPQQVQHQEIQHQEVHAQQQVHAAPAASHPAAAAKPHGDGKKDGDKNQH